MKLLWHKCRTFHQCEATSFDSVIFKCNLVRYKNSNLVSTRTTTWLETNRRRKNYRGKLLNTSLSLKFQIC